MRSRPGTRRTGILGTRTGRGYHIGHGHHHHHHHHHGGFYWRWGWGGYWGYGPGWGWGGWWAPAYPVVFGFGVSYYGPAYRTHFVETVPYEVPVIVEEVVVEPEEDPVVVENPNKVQPAVDEPQQQPAGPQEPVDPNAPAAEPHADFQPAVNAFLKGDYKTALEKFQSVNAAEPTNGEALLGQMHANFALGRYGAASKALADAAALDAFPRGYRFDPRPLYDKGPQKFDDAFAKLVAHTASNPDDVEAQLLVAYFQVALGEQAQATTAIHRVLELRPDDRTAPALAMALLPPPPPPEKSDAKGNAKK